MEREREKIYNISPNEFLSCVVVVGVVLFTLELIIVKFRV